MGRWQKPDEEVTDGAKYAREWADTEGGKSYRKQHAEYAKEWRKNNPEKFKASQKRAYEKVRFEALSHYSGGTPICSCCGETQILFLQIDHVNDDGAEHRRLIGMAQGAGEQKHKVNIGGNGLPYWLKKNNYPEGFQVLCANCNQGKRHPLGCPHNWNDEN